ncbi:MAG TPA: PEGA domain-containing protein [Patescibacteria group bacterium]
MKNAKIRRLLINILIIAVLAAGTAVAVLYAKGYRPDLKNRSIAGTGLLSVTSYPKQARVIINDRLTTVTDDKLSLSPGTYHIKIEKDGFHAWNKDVPIKPELVTSADARLFPIITATSPLTFYKASNPTVNSDGSKISYVLQNSPVEADNGLYVYSFTSNLLGSQNIQIADSSHDYSKALLIWSPDSSQMLAIFTEKTAPTKSNPQPVERIVSSQLLSTKSLNQSKNITDVTYRLPLIISEWQDQYQKINQPSLALYPKYISDILTQKSVNVYFSPDRDRVFYTPTENINLPENDIAKALPNINSTAETRNLTKGLTYVFDVKEGTNYLIPQAVNQTDLSKKLIVSVDATPSASINSLDQLKVQSESRTTTNLSWYGSRQLIVTNTDGVNIVDYDDLNLVNITAAQTQNNFIVPSPDGSKLVILTNINQKLDTFNLISFDLK